MHARVFYISRSDSYNESRGPTGDLKVDLTLCCRPQWLGVPYDVFKGVDMLDLVTYPALGQ
jgi:hypothetical protein